MKLFNMFKKKEEENTQEQGILDSINSVIQEVNRIEALFNEATDPNQIDAYSYQLSGLRSHHQHLIKELKRTRGLI